VSEPDSLISLYRFLARRAFFPLLLCTMLSFALLATRFYLTHSTHYRFLMWNLFLAWIPYWCSLAAVYTAQRDRGSRMRLAMLGFAWLIMFPNAPYIFTDMIHVISEPTLRWWFDTALVLSYALTGCFLGIVSLRIMHDLVRPRVGEIGGWLFVMISAGLSGFGVYLGRFHRFNSWDLVLRPQRIVPGVYAGLMNPLAHPRSAAVTIMFGTLVMICYVIYTTTNPRNFAVDPDEQPLPISQSAKVG